jgi:hypothetical protein
LYGIKNKKDKLICVFNLSEYMLHKKWVKNRPDLKIVKTKICSCCKGNIYVVKQ